MQSGAVRISKYEYDGAGNLIREWKPINPVDEEPAWEKTEYGYDSRGNLAYTVQYDGNAVAGATCYTYDGMGNMLTLTTGLSAPYASDGQTTSYTYDRFGNVLTMTDALGRQELYFYTGLGRLLEKEDRNGVTISYTYDGLGRIIEKNAGGGTDSETVRYTYTMTGQPAMEETPWQRTEYEYDALGRVTEITETELAAPEVPSVSLYTVTLDANGGTVAPTSVKAAEGGTYSLPTAVREGYTFDGWYLGDIWIRNGDAVDITGDSTFVAHWMIATYTVTLDANGGTVFPSAVEVTADGTYELPTPTRSGYNFTGWYLDSAKIENGDPVQITADSTLVAQWTPIGEECIITYHGNGGTVGGNGDPSLWDAAEYTQTSIIGEPVTLMANQFSRSGYSFIGWSRSRIAAYATYEDCQRVTDFPEGSTIHLYAVWYKGDVGIIPKPPAGENMSLPAAPALLSAPDTAEPEYLTYTKQYAYDLAGNRTSFAVVCGGETIQSISYTYDALNRLSTVAVDGNVQASYTYDVNGNRASLCYANGVETRYSYNGANWVTEVENRQNGELLSSYSYTYYASGSQASKTDHTGSHTTYRHDGLGRLTEESESGGVTLQYQYDAAGNRTGLVCSGVESYSVSYVYDECNRLLQETRSEDGETSLTHYTYDANGNLLTKAVPSAEVGGEQVQVCSYNGFGQLTGLTVNSVGAAYAYNARGIRTSKQVGPIRTSYVLDGGNVVGEVEGGQVTASYTRGMNLLSAEMGGEESYYLYNAHGDVVQLTSPAGDVTRSYAYDAFGSERTRDEGDANPFRYCGEYYDGETGTYYLRARYYDPALGRFTQQDTHWNPTNMIYGDEPGKINQREDALGLTAYSYTPQITAIMQSGNLYVYGLNNPIMYRDSSGNEIVLTCILIGAAIGTIVNAGTRECSHYRQ